MSKKNVVDKVSKDRIAAKRKAFEEAVASMGKKYTNDAGSVLYKFKGTKATEFVPSGSITLDAVLGGGIPVGRIIEIYGPEGSGKTAIALACAAGIQRRGGNVVFVDAENAFDPVFAESVGVNVDELVMFVPDTAEQALDGVYDLISTGSVDAVIIDSIAALVPKETSEKSAESSTIALKARLLAAQLPKLAGVCKTWGTTLLCINQVRDSMQMYGPSETTTGGKALKFYASLRFRVKRDSKVIENDKKEPERVGVDFKIIKYKNGIGFGQARTELNFNTGFNTALEVLEIGEKFGLIVRRGSNYRDAKTNTLIANGKDNSVRVLQDTPEMLAHYIRLIYGKIDQMRQDRVDDLKEQAKKNSHLRELIESGKGFVFDNNNELVDNENDDDEYLLE